jgi:hypothetical protein
MYHVLKAVTCCIGYRNAVNKIFAPLLKFESVITRQPPVSTGCSVDILMFPLVDGPSIRVESAECTGRPTHFGDRL